ncbi:MAG: thioredoxin-disulfide reductase [Flavobacteriales bacterium]
MTDRIEEITCAIIGSGPAGYTAAIYAARADLHPVMYTGMAPGGQLTTTTEVDNFPGYPSGVQGPVLMEDLRSQAERFGTDVRLTSVTAVAFSKERGGWHKLVIDGGGAIRARSVIIGTGASAKYLGLESEKRLLGNGVSACATCDGFFFKGQRVAVVGGGDSAVEEATYLAKLCRVVYLLIRKGRFRASKAMQHRAENTENLKVLFHTELREVLGEQVVTGIEVFHNETGKVRQIELEGVFLAIGHRPNTAIFKGQLEMDPLGYLVAEPDSTRTALPGVFAAGDVRDKVYRQAVTAAGSGCMAALDAEKYLASVADPMRVG